MPDKSRAPLRRLRHVPYSPIPHDPVLVKASRRCAGGADAGPCTVWACTVRLRFSIRGGSGLHADASRESWDNGGYDARNTRFRDEAYEIAIDGG